MMVLEDAENLFCDFVHGQIAVHRDQSSGAL